MSDYDSEVRREAEINTPLEPTELDKAIEDARFAMREHERLNTQGSNFYPIKESTLGLLIDAAERLKEVEKERDDNEYMGNLLAVVHCDGGHHRAEHGSKNSTDDAIKIVNNLKVEIDQFHTAYKEALEALNRLWEEDEMGWIIGDNSKLKYECVKCGASSNAKDMPHNDGCVQGYIYKSLSNPLAIEIMKEKKV